MCDVIHIWTWAENPRFQVTSDGEMFIATIHAGIAWETHIAVGYSSPNFALGDDGDLQARTYIGRELDDAATTMILQEELEDELPNLLILAKAANKAYNDFICGLSAAE